MRAALGQLPLETVTSAVLRTFRDTLLQRHTPGTVRVYLYILSGAFTFAVKECDWVPDNPFRKVRFPTAAPAVSAS